MKISAPLAALLSALLVAGAIVYHAQTQRYQLAAAAGGFVVRLDTRTGETVVCLVNAQNDRFGKVETIVAPCTGRPGH